MGIQLETPARFYDVDPGTVLILMYDFVYGGSTTHFRSTMRSIARQIAFSTAQRVINGSNFGPSSRSFEVTVPLSIP